MISVGFFLVPYSNANTAIGLAELLVYLSAVAGGRVRNATFFFFFVLTKC